MQDLLPADRAIFVLQSLLWLYPPPIYTFFTKRMTTWQRNGFQKYFMTNDASQVFPQDCRSGVCYITVIVIFDLIVNITPQDLILEIPD